MGKFQIIWSQKEYQSDQGNSSEVIKQELADCKCISMLKIKLGKKCLGRICYWYARQLFQPFQKTGIIRIREDANILLWSSSYKVRFYRTTDMFGPCLKKAVADRDSLPKLLKPSLVSCYFFSNKMDHSSFSKHLISICEQELI